MYLETQGAWGMPYYDEKRDEWHKGKLVPALSLHRTGLFDWRVNPAHYPQRVNCRQFILVFRLWSFLGNITLHSHREAVT